MEPEDSAGDPSAAIRLSDQHSLTDLRSLLRRASRTASRYYRSQLAQFDLSASQATALLFLSERHGATVRELAGALSADLATASALVDRLMSQGWIRRETDPDDRRRARLLLSDKAVGVLEPLQQATDRTNAMLSEALGAEQASQLAALLERLLDGLIEPSTPPARSEGSR
jgi:DNA-binding MarR family transcriptional regulator